MDPTPPSRSLRVGDPIRLEARRALLTAAAVAAFFAVFAAVSTQVASFRAQSPWGDDPYDAVVSFTEWFVPALVILGAVRAQLCRSALPLPVERVTGLMRASRAVAVIVGATVLVDWIGLALGADRAIWGTRTVVLVSGLAVLTGLLVLSVCRTRRVTRQLPGHTAAQVDGDWSADLVPLAAMLAGRSPRAGRPLVRMIGWIDAHALDGSSGIRRRPLACLLGASTGAAVVVTGAQALREGGLGWIVPVDLAIAAGGFFAFAVIANRSLHLVDVRPPDGPVGRSAWMAATLAALALPVSMAFRDPIWRGLGLGMQVSSLPQLTAILATAFVVVLVLSFVGARLLIGTPSPGDRSA